MIQNMQKTVESEPIFDFSKRNQPPICGDCGGKMIEASKEYLKKDTPDAKVLLCISCSKYFHTRKIMDKVRTAKDLFEEIDRRKRDSIWNQ